VLLVCEEMKLLGGTLFALDGCKLKSNASSQWSRTVSELRAKREKLEEKVKELLEEQEGKTGRKMRIHLPLIIVRTGGNRLRN
jgi:hypothetical protein